MISRSGIPRRIVGFHRDDEGDWVAELECGHGQHVRHRPPWQNRPWTETEEGRAGFVGKELLCVKCVEEGRDHPAADPRRVSDAATVEVVAEWQRALNSRDTARVLELSSPGIVIVGPRGTAIGVDKLRAWLDGTHVALHPLRTFARRNSVVVTQRGVWTDPVTGSPMGESTLASAFEVEGGLVTRYARFDELEHAFTATGLNEGDEV